MLIVGGNKNPQVVQDIKNMFGTLIDEGKVTFTGMLRGEDLARCVSIFSFPDYVENVPILLAH
jgi:hypothetical protein